MGHDEYFELLIAIQVAAIQVTEDWSHIHVLAIVQFWPQVASPFEVPLCIQAVDLAAKRHADDFDRAIAIQVRDVRRVLARQSVDLPQKRSIGLERHDSVVAVVHLVVVDRLDDLHVTIIVEVDQHGIGTRRIVVRWETPHAFQRHRVQSVEHTLCGEVVATAGEQVPVTIAIDIHRRRIAATLDPTRSLVQQRQVAHVESSQVSRPRAEVAVEYSVTIPIDHDG